MQLILATGVFLAVSVWMTSATVDKCQEDEVIKHCLAVINEDRSFLPGLVRLAFHDCVGPAGCDGCLDRENADNGGLMKYIDKLEIIYKEKKINEFMTRADYWVLCSFVAIERGHLNAGGTVQTAPKLVMKYGRPHCSDTSPYKVSEADVYPSPHGTYSQTTGYFNKEFGLTDNETVALLGAHTLGRARRQNSGFINEWVAGEFSFDNEFYRDIVSTQIQWKLVGDDDNDTNPHYQWVHADGKFLMFTSDMCLSRDVQPEDNTGFVNQSFSSIPYSAGHSLVEVYARDNQAWLDDFAPAYSKMIEKLPTNSSVVLQVTKTCTPVGPDHSHDGSPSAASTSLATLIIPLSALLASISLL